MVTLRVCVPALAAALVLAPLQAGAADGEPRYPNRPVRLITGSFTKWGKVIGAAGLRAD